MPPSNDILEKLQGITDPVELRKIITVLRKNKPTHWSSNSVAPYYKEEVAKQVKIALDTAMQTREDQRWYYKDFPNKKPHTLYLKFNQGLKYLLDKMDPDGKYRHFYQCCSLRKEYGVSLLLEVHGELVDGSAANFLPSPVRKQDRTWRDDMEVYLESASIGDVFHRKSIALNDEELHDLMVRFAPLPNISAYITYKEIKLVKTE